VTPDARLPFGLLCAVCLCLIALGIFSAWTAGLVLVGVLYVVIGVGCLFFFASLGRAGL
jgi:hypothetical protein